MGQSIQHNLALKVGFVQYAQCRTHITITRGRLNQNKKHFVARNQATADWLFC